jgi:hypothetical protein
MKIGERAAHRSLMFHALAELTGGQPLPVMKVAPLHPLEVRKPREIERDAAHAARDRSLALKLLTGRVNEGYLPWWAKLTKMESEEEAGDLSDMAEAFVALMKALQRHDVEYLLVGGMAINLHGLVRATEDIDLFVRPTPDNIGRLKAAATALFSPNFFPPSFDGAIRVTHHADPRA